MSNYRYIRVHSNRMHVVAGGARRRYITNQPR